MVTTVADMIVSSSEDKNKREKELPAIASSDDAPPTYSTVETAPPALDNAAPSGSSSAFITPTQQPLLRPTNNVSISRTHGSVKGAWLVDPTVQLPRMLLPPLLPDETEDSRRNISLQSLYGEVDADVTLAPFDWSTDPKKVPRKQTTIYAKSQNGSVSIRVHTESESAPRLPFRLQIDASHGSISVYIPRSFNGLLSLKMDHGSSKFSSQILTNLTTFSDVDKVHKCFIGDYSTIMEGEAWSGDEIVLDAGHGSFKLSYDDEANPAGGKQNFFGKLFGL